MRKIMFLALVVAASVFAVSCQKGDAGPAGATGAAGPAGPAGPAGAAGTANIYYSKWFNASGVTKIDSAKNTDGTYTYLFGFSITEALVTDDIVNKGMVKVYINVGTTAAPTVVEADAYGFTVGVRKGAILLNYIDVSFPAYPFRYVIIPGGTPASNSVDWKNYAKVQEFLNIQN
ncbi:hypothetical protein QEG73_15470 [Chitinophagaceae bacterium 26-R-25]|nr:hypothetical protein [Chitinophagaceae bacterium 26-R-25]